MAAEVVPRICVVGGGLPGLAASFFLQRHLPHAKISLVERSIKCGGSRIRTLRGSDGRIFEAGLFSSILVDRRGREALGLIRQLGLDDEVVTANIEASARRHLFHKGRVTLFPRVPHMLSYGPALLAEPLWSRGKENDESVHSFVARRSSTAVADRLANPICRGQLCGDAHTLSVRTCFPRLWFNEKQFRSVFVGSMLSTFAAYRRRSWLSLDLSDHLLQRVAAGGRCYSFRSGLETLTDRLEAKLKAPASGVRPVEIHTETKVESVRVAEGQTTAAAEVCLADGRCLEADVVVAAVPPEELARLLGPLGLSTPYSSSGVPSVSDALQNVKFRSVAVVNMGFDSDVLKGQFSGAGYFCGSMEDQKISAATWDSQLFPQQQPTPGNTRATFYMSGDDVIAPETAETDAATAARQHLGIEKEPQEVHTSVRTSAAPQYAVGHDQFMRAFNAARVRHLPWLQTCGPGYFGTRGVADEIVDARELADALSRRYARFPGLVENEVDDDVAHRFGAGFAVD